MPSKCQPLCPQRALWGKQNSEFLYIARNAMTAGSKDALSQMKDLNPGSQWTLRGVGKSNIC